MKAKTFTESQIVKILKELDSGKLAADVAREMAFQKRHYTTGVRSMAVWEHLNFRS